MTTFEIGETDFLLDGRPHRIVAGALHYFRVHPDLWADRIRKARDLGLNTIETYVAWNAHEPRRGEWSWEGQGDLGRFLDLVAAEGMHAIVRPGPYICAEWHNGGLPVWLTATDGIELRRSDATYLAEVDRYLRRVSEVVVPRQVDRGGPVILVQIENEYGAYGDDADYLRELVRITRDSGVTVPLTTIDQPEPEMLRRGGLPELHRTGSFGSRVGERLATLRAFQPTGPLMCAEFWNGWFDWHGGVHHTTSAAAAAAELDELLAAGASVSLYMFHGGTNAGFTNGANHKGRHLPITTSYDYDAPLDEAGDPTEKYWAFREVIGRHASLPAETPAAGSPAPVFTAPLEAVDVGPWWHDASESALPPTFERLGHLGPLVHYETRMPDGDAPRVLAFDDVRDQAWITVDGVRVGTIRRTSLERSIVVPPGERLEVLVEDTGRVNYGPRIGEAKGLIGTPRLDGARLEGWSSAPIDVEALARAASTAAPATAQGGIGPLVLRAGFELEMPTRLFLETSNWGRGVAVLNGWVLGRYSRGGPQQTLFVPHTVTRSGANELVVVELDHLLSRDAEFVASARLGPLEE